METNNLTEWYYFNDGRIGFDIFRKQKPYTKSFSYESKFLTVKSRLDYFLIAKHLTQYVHNNETKTSYNYSIPQSN